MTKYSGVIGFPGYRVGDDGTVWSRWIPHGGRKGKLRMAWRQLHPTKRKGNHLFVSLCHRGQQKSIAVHRLVLEAFCGLCPSGFEGRHLNGNSLDNRAQNLTWGSHIQNCRDGRRHRSYRCGESHYCAKLTAIQVIEIRRCLAAGESPCQLIRRYPVVRNTIRRLRSPASWRGMGVVV